MGHADEKDTVNRKGIVMKICTIVGARPQFIKAGPLSRVLQREHEEIIIHTGQHYDSNMSSVFFDELNIPKPKYNLGISGGTHAQMTGKMLSAIEEALLAEQPDMVVVFGDTNSTLAGALAAVKLQIPIAHIEAGCRVHDLRNPEEVNRVLVDRISSLLLCATQSAVTSLENENLRTGLHFTGDLMYDAALYYGDKANEMENHRIVGFNDNLVNLPPQYYLLTCHRQENTETDAALFQILSAMNELDKPTIYPVHPRNRERADRLCTQNSFSNIMLIQPVGYLSSLYLIRSAEKIVTDSGGVQREAWFFNKQCVTVWNWVAWPETLEGNINQMAMPQKDDIIKKLQVIPDFAKKAEYFGDGHAAEKITKVITDFLTNRTQ